MSDSQITKFTVLIFVIYQLSQMKTEKMNINIGTENYLFAVMTKVAIIGHRGYIGSFLCANMQVSTPLNNTRGKDVYVSEFDVVIYLGGIVGHQRCETLTSREVFDANVGDIMAVAANMKQGALLIYSSTAALYEGYGMSAPKEDAILNEQLFDQYMNSMYNREKNIRTLTHIKSAALRLGTVIGISPNQKRTSIHIKMLRDAVLFGKVRVQGAHMGRSILSIQDLKTALESMIEKRDQIQGHQIYNMCSFNCTVAKIANEIGCKTGSNIVYEKDNDQQKRAFGFSMDNQKATTQFGFEWRGRNSILVEELIANLKHVCNSDAYLNHAKDGAKCRVCKREDNMAVLCDFGKQPNANHYLSCPEGALEEYPLRLDLCRNCYHTQLSYTIPPAEVFSNYIYLSGTSNTMREFFRDFADKSIRESGIEEGKGTVLEIACNDGSLLDWYKARGWRTFGYDPAKNIEPISSAKGHEITVGFWGQDPTPEYPSLDIIVAQNVCAHVPDPVAFLEKCREVMSDKTVLYVQTSQSEMIERGQYDTAYHEHLSFFTVRSMDIAAKMAGLCLDGVEKTAVHGSSYIFRFRLQSNTDITQNEIYKYEREIGLYDDLLYYVYVEKVNELSSWLSKWCTTLTEKGAKIVGYGAAAKGMTVLNSLRWKMPFKYIADDSLIKQGYYATNRKYRIVAPIELGESADPLVIYVLAWNFIDEIKERVMRIRQGSPTYFMVTYPLKKVWYVEQEKEYVVYEEIDTRFTKASVHHRNILISHFYNEEALLSQWIRHHAPLFDCAVLIDYHSTDKSREIIRREAPDSWNVVYSHNSEFGAMAIDAEVSGYENSFDNNHWRLALTTTEFLFATGLRRKDNTIFCNVGDAIRVPSLTSVDREDAPKNDLSMALAKQKNLVYFQDGNSGILTEEEERYVNNHYNRFMHRIRDFHNPYYVGRHEFRHSSVSKNMHIIKYVYGPFPDFYSRKLQIKTRMPESDKRYNFGHQHLIEYAQLDADYKRKQALPLININDEASQRAYFDKYMREVAAGDQLLSGIYANLYD